MKQCPYWNFVRQKILLIHVGNTDAHKINEWEVPVWPRLARNAYERVSLDSLPPIELSLVTK